MTSSFSRLIDWQERGRPSLEARYRRYLSTLYFFPGWLATLASFSSQTLAKAAERNALQTVLVISKGKAQLAGALLEHFASPEAS